MSTLFSAVRELEAVRRKQAVPATRKQELEHNAWLNSPRTISRARQLMAEATLSLMTQGIAIDAASLNRESSAWLPTATGSLSHSAKNGWKRRLMDYAIYPDAARLLWRALN